MQKTLSELREGWETDLRIKFELPIYVDNCLPIQLDKLLVVLQDKDNLFHVHIYFPISMAEGKMRYEISADLQRGTADQVFGAINHRFPDGVKSNIMALI
jgi:hypothetical protein